MRTWVDVAVLVKTKNLSGRFVAKSAAGLLPLLEPGVEVAFVPPKLDVPRRAVVSAVYGADGTGCEIEFDGIDSSDVAGELVGMHCLVRRDALDESVLEKPSALWDGWQVVDDELGIVGEVAEIIDNPGQSLLEVRRAAGTVLIPLVDEIVYDVDAENGNILKFEKDYD